MKEDDDVAISAQETIADTEYADNGTLLVDNNKKAQNIMERVLNSASKTGLVISIPKTSYFSTKEKSISQWRARFRRWKSLIIWVHR
ncbi:hypothetical protein QYM36_016679 [Artemia franciscana]|uniref:Reverse transcriptase domain-containing protein n=1 Tax=Artemia franciscana TaxID=6661 RepID=A0AA88KW29_ARTSF|nr:hypothetical protein QYM36_016679 [Artemia franciscana]